MSDLTPEQKADARSIFQGEVEGKNACYHCGGLHIVVANLPATNQPCPRVKKIEYAPTGQTIAVEYWPWSDWVRSISVVFPDDVYEDDDPK